MTMTTIGRKMNNSHPLRLFYFIRLPHPPYGHPLPEGRGPTTKGTIWCRRRPSPFREKVAAGRMRETCCRAANRINNILTPLTKAMSTRTPIARHLRKQQTLAEHKLWWLLRSRALEGFKFYRQHPIGPYFADFCCRTANLIVELDGSQHMDNEEYDQERTRFLMTEGYQVLRFWNNEVISQEKNVLQKILNALPPSPALRAPSP